MAQPVPHPSSVRNHLLTALPSGVLAQLLPKLRPVALELRQILHAADALIEAVYDRARAASASRVYWLTQADNARARALYDGVADNLGFIQYRKVL